MNICRAGLLVVLMVFILVLFGCGGGGHEEIVAPIHLEMPTDHLQKEIGVSGFILGTFMMLNGYIVIILSIFVDYVLEDGFFHFVNVWHILLFLSPG